MAKVTTLNGQVVMTSSGNPILSTDYTAGDGIAISTEKVISVNRETVPTKAEVVLHSEVGDVFSAETAYAIGDLCIYNNQIYKFTAAHAAGAWIGTDATVVKLKDAFAYKTALDNHTSNTSNPHGVTKLQLGLENVDNTSDANKPVSTAMQNALDAKQNALTFDTTPTLDSANPVTSNGIKAALDLKQNAQKIKTTLDAVAEVKTSYFLGEQTNVPVVLPTSPSIADEITIVFYSGSTATTLTISGTYLGTAPTPEANQRVELNFMYDGTNWDLVSKTEATT